jgi:hypothetical protein
MPVPGLYIAASTGKEARRHDVPIGTDEDWETSMDTSARLPCDLKEDDFLHVYEALDRSQKDEDRWVTVKRYKFMASYGIVPRGNSLPVVFLCTSWKVLAWQLFTTSRVQLHKASGKPFSQGAKAEQPDLPFHPGVNTILKLKWHITQLPSFNLSSHGRSLREATYLFNTPNATRMSPFLRLMLETKAIALTHLRACSDLMMSMCLEARTKGI